MVLDLKRVFSGEVESLSFDYTMDLSSVEFSGSHPFLSPVRIKGTVEGCNGYARLKSDVSFDFSIPCDRCTALTEKHYEYAFAHLLVPSLENSDDDDRYIEVPDYRLDLSGLMREDVLLELPTRFLCKPDCLGICPQCGKNLNDGPCGCSAGRTDPRLEVLKDLLH